jgi:hypothetical protein
MSASVCLYRELGGGIDLSVDGIEICSGCEVSRPSTKAARTESMPVASWIASWDGLSR